MPYYFAILTLTSSLRIFFAKVVFFTLLGFLRENLSVLFLLLASTIQYSACTILEFSLSLFKPGFWLPAKFSYFFGLQ
jgi:hypothetical protein